MAFGFNSSQGAMGGSSSANSGPDLETIATEDLGFLSVAGDAKLRLTSSWTSLPAPTASLLSIASRKGLVAAAGPDQVVIATTEAVRKGLEADKDGDSDVRKFTPQLTLPMPMRVSQLTFTADENYLILSAESGGGLAVYEVQSLLSGSTKPAFELPTNGEALRVLSPNPTAEKAELCAIVTSNGNLHMANLKEQRISDALKDQVSCVSWSSKGKQLCAGLANGTIHQMTPEGDAKAEIPLAPQMENRHVSSLTWLENHLWLAIYTSPEASPASSYYIITRQPPSSFMFQKIQDPIEPFGAEKVPHHSILRLRDFPPELQDLLIVSSTASADVGLLSRSKKPLATDKPADTITNVFTMTELLDDSKRPTLPMTDSMEDSTVIGSALDLSSKDKVYKPIPSDEELEESPSPLPGYWVLTHEGVLCPWWLVYYASIKQGTSYPGLAAIEAPGLTQSAPMASALTASPFSQPAAFGTSSAAPAFGSSTALGQRASAWGTPSAPAAPTQPQTGGATFGSSSFGSAPAASAPTFGQPSTPGFGRASQLGAKSSPWASGGVPTGATFGQSGFSSFTNSGAKASAFGSAAQATPSDKSGSGGFSSFASQGGFGSIAKTSTQGSLFGAPSAPSSNPFGSAVTGGSMGTFGSPAAATNSVFGAPSQPAANPFAAASEPSDSVFGKRSNKPSANPFGSEPFKLQSSFKPDPSALEDKPSTSPGPSMFGDTFGSALDSSNNKTEPSALSNEIDMDSEQTPQAKPPQRGLFPVPSDQESTTPTSTPAPSKFVSATPTSATPAPGSSLFGQPTPSTTSASSRGLFGMQQTPKASLFGGNLFGKTNDTSKSEEAMETPVKPGDNDVPLPPDTISRTAYPLGDSSASSAVSNNASSVPLDAPLPPDPSTTPRAAKEKDSEPLSFSPPGSPESAAGDAPLPPDFVDVPRPKTSTAAQSAPLPPDSTKPSKPAAADAPLPPDPALTLKGSSKTSLHDLPKVDVKNPFGHLAPPADETSESEVDDNESEGEEDDEDESEEGDDESEGSGVVVDKDVTFSLPSQGFTPQGSFGGIESTTPAGSFASLTSTTPGLTQTGLSASKPSFGDVSRNAPLFPRPNGISPRSPSPIRDAVPRRMHRSDRSVSAPGPASQIVPPNRAQSQLKDSIIAAREKPDAEDPFVAQARKMKAKQKAEENQPLVDAEDDEVQRILASELEGTLVLDEFIAHSNTAPPAHESVPSQVEAVYRDINSMIDTVGLNSRSVKAFIKGHSEPHGSEIPRKDRLECPDDWVLCEIDELGRIMDTDLPKDLEQGRVQDFPSKSQACKDLSRDMQRLRAKHEHLKQIVHERMDPEQVEAAQSLPLSTEQLTQQNELRKDFTKFSKLMAETEEALMLLKTRIASASSSSSRGSSNVPTVEAIMRTITKMTSMVEKRSGDIDVLENQMRRVRLESVERDGPPMTPQARRSIMFSPESTPSRNLRHSFAASVGSISSPGKASPRKKLSGFTKDEKVKLMDKKARRQAVLSKLKESVEKKGVSVWTMENVE